MYYRSTQRLSSVYSAQLSVQLVTSSKEHRRKLSQHQKFRKASIVTTELASDASNVHFKRRIKVLKELVSRWKDGEEVALVEVNPSKLWCGSLAQLCSYSTQVAIGGQ